MKKVFLFLISLSLLFCVSCSKKAEPVPLNIKPVIIQEGNVTYQADPRLELLSIALRLATVKAFYFNTNDEYISTVDKLVEKYKKHDLIKQLKKYTWKYKGTVVSELEIAKYISEDFTKLNFDSENLPPELEAFWGNFDLDKFIRNFNDFARQIQFERIWKLYEGSFKIGMVNTQTLFAKNDKIVPWVNDYFYDSNHQVSYIINVSPMFASIIDCANAQNQRDSTVLTLFMSPNLAVESINDVLIALRLSYSINKTLFDENWAEILELYKPFIDKVYAQNKISTKKYKYFEYTDALAYMLEDFSLPNYLAVAKDEDEASEIMDYFLGYIMVEDSDKWFEAFKYYEENRAVYADYEDFFKNYLMTEFAEKL